MGNIVWMNLYDAIPKNRESQRELLLQMLGLPKDAGPQQIQQEMKTVMEAFRSISRKRRALNPENEPGWETKLHELHNSPKASIFWCIFNLFRDEYGINNL